MRSSMTTVHDYVSPHRHATVDVHTEVSGWLDRMNWAVADLYVSNGNVMATACRSAPSELCLLCVQLQPIAGCPTRDVDDALRHVGLERAGIRQWGPAVNLGVICVQMRMQTVIGTDRLLTIGQVRIDGRTDRFAISYRASVCWRAIMTQD